MGWVPPGMAMGGVFATPTTVTVGDIPGRIPEIVAPQPMMKQSVKDAITVDDNGKPTVNKQPLALRQSRIEAGIAG